MRLQLGFKQIQPVPLIGLCGVYYQEMKSCNSEKKLHEFHYHQYGSTAALSSACIF